MRAPSDPGDPLQSEVVGFGAALQHHHPTIANRHHSAQHQRQRPRPAPTVFENTQPLPVTPEAFGVRYEDADNRVATGLMHNAYTGEWFETFEDQIPPPNTTKGSISHDALRRTNPRLVHMQGGFDHNAKRPQKQEISWEQEPLSGRSAVGPQRYSRDIRQRATHLVKRDTFGARNHEHPEAEDPDAFWGQYGSEPAREQPTGYVGYVPRHRYTPHMPATQELDLKGYAFTHEVLGTDLGGDERHQWDPQPLVTRGEDRTDAAPAFVVRPKDDISHYPRRQGLTGSDGIHLTLQDAPIDCSLLATQRPGDPFRTPAAAAEGTWSEHVINANQTLLERSTQRTRDTTARALPAFSEFVKTTQAPLSIAPTCRGLAESAYASGDVALGVHVGAMVSQADLKRFTQTDRMLETKRAWGVDDNFATEAPARALGERTTHATERPTTYLATGATPVSQAHVMTARRTRTGKNAPGAARTAVSDATAGIGVTYRGQSDQMATARGATPDMSAYTVANGSRRGITNRATEHLFRGNREQGATLAHGGSAPGVRGNLASPVMQTHSRLGEAVHPALR